MYTMVTALIMNNVYRVYHGKTRRLIINNEEST